jgi:predicted PurR-regulated permease PerM
MARQTIDISTSTLVRFVLIILAALLLYFLRNFVLMVFGALILAIAFDRPIDSLEKRGVPRILGVILMYLLVFSVISFLFYLVLPVLATQIKNLVLNYSFYLKKISQLQPKGSIIDLRDLFDQLAEKMTASATTVFGTLVSFFGGFISFLTVLIAAVFLNVQERGVKKFVFYLTPEKHQNYVLRLFDRIQKKVGAWLWGRILIAVILAILVAVGLYFLKIKYALLLGFLAALLGFIPFLGPIAASIPAILIALAQSPLLAVFVLLWYLFVYSIFENFFLIPLLMKKAVDLNPALIILVVLLGSKIAGILGIILAIPAAAIVSVLIDEYIQLKSKRASLEVLEQ